MIRSLSKHSNYLFVFNNFYSLRKLDYLFVCLKIYYKYLALPKNVLVLVRDVRQLFYSLYDEYAKFHSPSLNINFEQDVHSAQAPTNRIGKDYQLLF